MTGLEGGRWRGPLAGGGSVFWRVLSSEARHFSFSLARILQQGGLAQLAQTKLTLQEWWVSPKAIHLLEWEKRCFVQRLSTLTFTPTKVLSSKIRLKSNARSNWNTAKASVLFPDLILCRLVTVQSKLVSSSRIFCSETSCEPFCTKYWIFIARQREQGRPFTPTTTREIGSYFSIVFPSPLPESLSITILERI